MRKKAAQSSVGVEERVWATISKALGADLREHRTIQGVSGIQHPVQGIAVDDKGKRIIVFSSEANPRVAALMQVDVQSTMQDFNVLVARPVVFDLGAMARQIFQNASEAQFRLQDIASKAQLMAEEKERTGIEPHAVKILEAYLNPVMQAFDNVRLPALSQITDVIQQISHLNWDSIISSLNSSKENAVILLAELMFIDNIAIDRDHGICPLPLYEFTENDWELLASGLRVGDVQARLKQLDIYQYFFPSPDQLALGAVERGISRTSEVIDFVNRAPNIGHPLSGSELLPSAEKLPEILERLSDQGYVAEGEYGMTVTNKGATARAKIKFRPREGVIVKLINRFSAKINLSLNPKDMI